MLRAVASSPDRVVCVVGLAGSGKTTAARAVADAFRAARVSGARRRSFRHRRREAAGRDRHPLDNPPPAPPAAALLERCLVVVDEAGMAETRVLAPLLERVEHAQAKIVLIGDPSSCPRSAPVASSPASSSVTAPSSSARTAASATATSGDALESIRNGLGRDYLAFAEGKGGSSSPTRR